MSAPKWLTHFGLSSSPFTEAIADEDLWVPSSRRPGGSPPGRARRWPSSLGAGAAALRDGHRSRGVPRAGYAVAISIRAGITQPR
ncbi:MAG: hypothetical protein CMN29_33520 [Sandaracinus sp.]|nr:hypothetical protein [Sandaracinus sp.]